MEDVRLRIRRTFQLIDQNGDGVISRSELCKVLGLLDPQWRSPAHLEAVFSAADLDKDGKINIDEFLSWAFRDPEGEAFMEKYTASQPLVTANSLLSNVEACKRYKETCFQKFDVMKKEFLVLDEVCACVEEVFKHVGLKVLPAHVVEKAVAEQSSLGGSKLTLPDFQSFFDRMLQFISKHGAGEKEMLNFDNDVCKGGPTDGIYVADSWYSNVQFFAKGSSNAVVVAGNACGIKYYERSAFCSRGLALDSENGLYVCNRLQNQVQYFVKGISSAITVAGGRGEGCDASQLSSPLGLALDMHGLYVADSGNNRVQFFAKGSMDGVTVAGEQSGELNGPDGLATDQAGGFYVADSGNHRVLFFQRGASEGLTVAGGQGAGNSPEQLNGPGDIALDPEGGLYVADVGNSRLQYFQKCCAIGVTIAEGKGLSVAVDATGNVYVADNGGGKPPYSGDRIRLFAKGCSTAETVLEADGGTDLGTAIAICVATQRQLVLSLHSKAQDSGCLNIDCLTLSGESVAALDITPDVSVRNFLDMLSAKGGALRECALQLLLPDGRLVTEEDYGLQLASILQQ